jgi:hypothetical protein
MAIVDLTYRSLTCNAPGCDKTVTFETPREQQSVVEANPWLKTGRIIQTSEGKNFFYDSDLCEIAGIEAGFHNPKEAPKVEIPTGSAQAQIAAAAAAAKAREDATQNIRDGKPVTLHTS